MLSVLLERLNAHFDKKLPFVAYRRPNEKQVMAVFQHSSDLHMVADFKESGFVFAPFDSGTPPVLIQAEERFTADVGNPINLGPMSFPAMPSDVADKAYYLNLVAKAKSEINNGRLRKVVLSRVVPVACPATPIALFKNLLSRYDTAFCYLWHHPKVGTWLGATPEILLRSTNHELTTMSLAGTQKYEAGKEPIWGKKELDEQLLVTEYIASALEGKASGLKFIGPDSLRAGNLWHLRTKINGRIEGYLSEIIRVLHPTPAVCGLPLVAAKDFIMDNEDYDREFYTGYLGELNLKVEKTRTSSQRNQENKAYRAIRNTSELYVNLRCMKLCGEKANIYVGGGITTGSDMEREWEETVDKALTMLRVLHDA